jgi:RNA polymerase sigma-70 factor (ECF subfamily)
MFAVPFDDIAPMVDRTPDATRQLASRARRRVQGNAPVPDGDVRQQREVVDAFFAAARDGDFDRLVAVLHPDVVLRADAGDGTSTLRRGAKEVASNALMFSSRHPYLRRALVNGAAGVVVAPDDEPIAVMGFTVVNGRVVEIDVVADPKRLAELNVRAVIDPR